MKHLHVEFINPFLMNSLPREGIVRSGHVQVAGFTLDFRRGETPYPDGTRVRVWCSRDLVCESLQEIELRRQERARQAEMEARQDFARRSRRRLEAYQFNRGLNVPVKWKPEIKHVIGGLTVNSSGNGQTRRSVWHIYLLEDLEEGRLKRSKHSFLCTQQEGCHFGELIDPHSMINNHIKVTCKSCLAIAKRWQKSEEEYQ